MFNNFLARSCFALMLVVSHSLAAVEDPTKPDSFVGGDARADKPFALQSVFMSNTRKVAIINGESYHEGDRLAIGEIIKIESGQVTVQGSKTVLLKIDELPTIKQNTESK